MSSRRLHKVFFILAAIAVLLGMCFEGGKTDSYFAYASSGKTESCFALMNAHCSNTQACTPEMLGVYTRNIGIRQIAGRFISSGREVKLFSAFLCSILLFPEEGKSFKGLDNRQFYCSYQEALITNYIHKLDGKKRS